MPTRAQDIVSLLRGHQTAAELAARHGVSEAEVLAWKDLFLSGLEARTAPAEAALANVAAAVDYIHRNDFATNTGANIGFVANIGGTPHTYIFNQVGNNGNTTNDILVDLVGVSSTTLSGANLAPAGMAGTSVLDHLERPTTVAQ